MRITASENYFHERECFMDDCDRRYCSEHRLLWKDCDTAISVRDGAGQVWWELSDCPECVKDARTKRFSQMMSISG